MLLIGEKLIITTDYLFCSTTLMDVNILKSTKMNTSKFHHAVTKTGIISLAALAVIGIIVLLFTLCQFDSDFLPYFLEEILYFVLLTLAILVGFCFPVSFLMTLISIANSLKKDCQQ